MVDVAVGVQVIIAAVLGGRRTILGAALGAIFLIVAGELLRPIGELATFIVSAVALLVVLFFPGGFLGIGPVARGTRMMDAVEQRAPVLEVRGLTKRFGGLIAVKNLASTCTPAKSSA